MPGWGRASPPAPEVGMRRWMSVFASILCVTGCGAGLLEGPEALDPSIEAAAIAPPPLVEESTGPAAPVPPAWIGGAPSQSILVAGEGSTIHLGVWVSAPEAAARGPRAPLSMSLVIDGSGSMAGDKIEHARLAATSLLESLAPGDQVSIAAFSDEVAAIARPTVVGPDSLGELFGRVRRIEAMGSTNLHDGLLVGASWAASSAGHPVRRVVVISDGQANVGPSTPDALGDVAARWTEAAVQVSAIGVGTDYDEQTLGALALRSAGRLYHLQEPSQMAQILEQEVRLLGNTVALGATLEIVPGEGVELLDAEFVGARRRGEALRVDLGALYAGQRREVLIRARVRGGSAGSGERELASARLSYRPRADRPERALQEIPLRAAFGADAEAARRSAHPRVRAMLARHEAAVAQQKAAEMLNAGQSTDAASVLEGAERELATVAQSLPEGEERARITEQAARIGQTKTRARAATTRQVAREAALDSYSYSFSDEGLSAPTPKAAPRPSKK